MKRKGLFITIRSIVSKIPKGKVVTYGDIARVLGLRNSRIVGWALRGNQDPNIPCHRVVKKNGFLAENFSLGTWKEQKRLLKAEKVKFIKKNQVDLNKHYWQIT